MFDVKNKELRTISGPRLNSVFLTNQDMYRNFSSYSTITKLEFHKKFWLSFGRILAELRLTGNDQNLG